MPEHNSRSGLRGLQRVARDFDRLVERRVLQERDDRETLRVVERLERELAEMERKSAATRRQLRGR